jgi:hypothetical protein
MGKTKEKLFSGEDEIKRIPSKRRKRVKREEDTLLLLPPPQPRYCCLLSPCSAPPLCGGAASCPSCATRRSGGAEFVLVCGIPRQVWPLYLGALVSVQSNENNSPPVWMFQSIYLVADSLSVIYDVLLVAVCIVQKLVVQLTGDMKISGVPLIGVVQHEDALPMGSCN